MFVFYKERRREKTEREMTERPKFVLFGSSIVQYNHFDDGWGTTLSHLYARKVDIVFRGYAAWNSRRALQILDKVFPKDAPMQPSLVIVYFGGNDSTLPHSSGLGPHVPIEEYVQNMRRIAEHLMSLSEKTRLIFLSTPPVDDDKIPEDSDGKKSKTNELCRQYSEACLELCRKMNIKAIDMWSAIQERPDWKEVCLYFDGVHLAAEGSKIVSQKILKTLKEAKWEPSLYWNNMPSEFGEDSPYDPVAADGQSTLNASHYAFPHPSFWGESHEQKATEIVPQLL